MIEEPEWMKILKPDALVSVKEVAPIFGLKPGSLKIKISRGTFIKPHTTPADMSAQTKQFGFSITQKGDKKDKMYFRVCDIRKLIKEQKQ